ncbi:MAG TPA: hypothetical protein PLU72_19270 [Candidatus Ozemobacteraceae bacterium]|nr:hypothetical protein [Candidatus Ozemobacteraceae bacterium]HQG27437.1 hypothetical protein [Candidatus Ozemobacteraceae bacterium]
MTTRRSFLLIRLLPVLFLLAVCNRAAAIETQFEFVYQKVTAIEYKEEKQDRKWWEKAIDFGKTVLDKGKMVVDQARMRFFPDDYSGPVRSCKDGKVSYKVERVTVRDEAHLLQLMGVKNGDLSTLTNGQLGLLESYRYSKSQAVKERAAYGYKKDVKVLLTDLTEGEKLIAAMNGQKKADVASAMRKDFWPMSLGSIQLNSQCYAGSNWKTEAQGLFMHEFCHTLDRAIPAGLLDEGVKTFVKQGGFLYGSDGTHYLDERTSARVAFMEGWAMFNEISVTGEADYYRRSLKTIRIEDRSGNYKEYPAASLTGKDLLAVEGVNALILNDIVAAVPGGKEKMFKAFAASNQPFHSLKHLASEFVKQNPDQAGAVLAAIDANTLGKLSNAELKALVGEGAAVDAWLAARKTASTPVATSTADVSTENDSGVKVIRRGSNPFGVGQ